MAHRLIYIGGFIDKSKKKEIKGYVSSNIVISSDRKRNEIIGMKFDRVLVDGPMSGTKAKVYYMEFHDDIDKGLKLIDVNNYSECRLPLSLLSDIGEQITSLVYMKLHREIEFEV